MPRSVTNRQPLSLRERREGEERERSKQHKRQRRTRNAGEHDEHPAQRIGCNVVVVTALTAGTPLAEAFNDGPATLNGQELQPAFDGALATALLATG